MKIPVSRAASARGGNAASCWCLLSILLGLAWNPPATATPQPPVITSIQTELQNVRVAVSVPAGLRKITLESRDRLESGAWMPRVVARLDGQGGEVVFYLPIDRSAELLRVRADEEEPLPAAFYSGTAEFGGEPTASGSPTGYDDRLFAESGMTPDASGDASREVVESDLWQKRGDRLYFFNQLRGLQVIDIQDPDRPVLLGQFELPAAGEELYLLGETHVALLAQAGCYYNGIDASQIWLLAVESGVPQARLALPVQGQIVESRLVGSALYVASQSYRTSPGADGTIWEWGLVISSFDLSNPEHPEPRDTLWYPGYGNIVSATDRFFFVAAQEPSDWRRSIIHTIDISDPAGAMTPLHTLHSAGRVTDKFKLNVRGDIFTVISQVQDTQLLTTLETFSFADPEQPKALGSLSLGLSEQLHATRFVEDRVYVVTFFVPFRMDPLWVVDLSDPARPAITGELEIPGFSTFLHPLPGQLVALGVETNQTTVSLFDVADAAHPALLSRVALGDGWSWSEANWNEKAFSVNESEGLILVPFQSWSQAGYQRGVQLVDLRPDQVVLRGVIRQEFAPRRTTLHQNRILSVSGRELLTVDATDRDAPQIVQRTELAWPVERVFVRGDYLLEIEEGLNGWWDSAGPAVRVAHVDRRNEILDSLSLAGMPILGASLREDRLFLVQGHSYFYGPWLVADGTTSEDGDPAPANFVLTVLDLSQLPDLKVAHQVSETLPELHGSSWTAIWPTDTLLVWSGSGFPFWFWRGGMELAMADASVAWYPWWGGGGGGRLVAFDTDPKEAPPKLVSDLRLDTNGWWEFSVPWTARGLVYLSHRSVSFEEDMIQSGLTTIHEGKTGTWIQRYWLDVIDYADPEQPALRPPVNLPGRLEGLGRNGALLYTLGYQYDPNSGVTDWTERLAALAYDDVMAHLVDVMTLPNVWPRPLTVTEQGLVMLGRPGATPNGSGEPAQDLEAWTVPDSGVWTLVGQRPLERPVHVLEAQGAMLVARREDGVIQLFDLNDPTVLPTLGEQRIPGCLWYELNKGIADPDRGWWQPLGVYGVVWVPLEPR